MAKNDWPAGPDTNRLAARRPVQSGGRGRLFVALVAATSSHKAYDVAHRLGVDGRRAASTCGA